MTTAGARRAGWLLAAAVVASAAASAGAASLSRAEYNAHKRQIEADYQLERTSCDRLTHNDKDICMARAKGHEKVAKAELDFNNTGDEADRQRLAIAKADADRDVAVERCDDRNGRDKQVCVTEAEIAHTKALADARQKRPVSAAAPNAGVHGWEADVELAVAGVDAWRGSARADCMGLVTVRLGTF